MGVPAFYRWLSEKYPKIVQDMLEKRSAVVDGVEIPLNLEDPNPNGMEYDNLYIDLNGLIHPCSHPEDREAPTTEAEMYHNVTKYVDRLFAACRPRRLLFLAIDGVAPRAKMNQQRARRFRAAQEARERAAMMEEVVSEMTALGLSPPPSAGRAWDSNVITPGTEFMYRLSLYLWYYVLDRMNRVPAWRNIKVILSDASEPGEGEHKIMRFIRAQRSRPGFDPNQRHILHGLDADLIMLALATHEMHFTILREEVTFGRKDQVKSEAQRLLDMESAAISALHPQDEWVYGKPLQCLHIRILREYLYFEFRELERTLPFPFDLERIIDDFVFVCFFVGNDFLPHLPSLDIRDGALDFLIQVYKDLLPSMGEYVTSSGGNVNLRQLDVLLSKVGEVEDQVFQTRKAAEDREQYKRTKRSQYSNAQHGKSARDNLLAQSDPRAHLTALSRKSNSNGTETRKSSLENIEAAAKIKCLLHQGSDKKDGADDESVPDLDSEELEFAVDGSYNNKRKLGDTDAENAATKKVKQCQSDDVSDGMNISKQLVDKKVLSDEVKNRLKAKEQKIIEANKDTVIDTVKFHEYGWKARYYEDNFKKEDIAAGGGLQKMCQSYIEGLCWVLKYYYEGCPSWNWYYPFHYAPFASDLINVDTYDVKFELSKPFKPVEQLLAVLPADSVAALPEACSWLMTDKDSPIKDLYTDDIPIDPNGKILPWLWVVLLPFIDENRITAAMELCLDNLTEEETKRNSFGTPMVFVHSDHALASSVIDKIVTSEEATTFTAEEGQGIQGKLAIHLDSSLISPIDSTIPAPSRPLGAFNDIHNNKVNCFRYEYPEEGTHLSCLLEGSVPVESALTEYDGMPRRPPRLNRGGFNIIDMALNLKRDQQRQSGSYSHGIHGQAIHQPSSSFFRIEANSRYNVHSESGYRDYRHDSHRGYESSGKGANHGGGSGRYEDGKNNYSNSRLQPRNNWQNGKEYTYDNSYTSFSGKGGKGSYSGVFSGGGKGGNTWRRSGAAKSNGGRDHFSWQGSGFEESSIGGKGKGSYHRNNSNQGGGRGSMGPSSFIHRAPPSQQAPPSRDDYFSQPPPSFMFNSATGRHSSHHSTSLPPNSYPNQFAQVRQPASTTFRNYISQAPPPLQHGHIPHNQRQTPSGRGQQRDPRRR